MKKLDPRAGKELVERRHKEYLEHRVFWQRAQDSLQGGERYRNATYGSDPRDTVSPLQNLMRHKKEYAPPRRLGSTYLGPVEGWADVPMAGGDAYARAAEDSFRMRQARTPVPRFFHDAIKKHLSRIYAGKIHRKGPAQLEEFWKNVDGEGNTIDQWLAQSAAPLFLALGQLDLLVDHPSPPPGIKVANDSEVAKYRLDRVFASIILPENLVWWMKGERNEYLEVLIRECREDLLGNPVHVFRHWDAEGSVLYRGDGTALTDVQEHPYGRVPVIRVFDLRRCDCRNVGLSRYEGVLDAEREYYNEDSELILANTLQAHPTLQGPSQVVGPNGEVEVGPGGVLPIYSDPTNGVIQWSYVTPPKEAAQFLQQTKQGLVDQIDRQTCQTKPAGSASGGKPGTSTVSQSGVSKELDQRDGNDLLSKIAASMQKLEVALAEYALVVATNGAYAVDEYGAAPSIAVTYPGGFNLMSPEELAILGGEIQTFVESSGAMPEFETQLLMAMQRAALPGLDPEVMKRIETEAREVIEAQAARKVTANEGRPVAADAEPDGEPVPSNEGPDVIPAQNAGNVAA